MQALRDRYYSGDTIAITHESTSATSVVFAYFCGDVVREVPLTNSGGVWTTVIETSKLAGEMSYRLYVTTGGSTSVVQAGYTRIMPHMSEHRKTAKAIREAIERCESSPYTSHTFGEMSVSYRNIPELQKDYKREIELAEAEERGLMPVEIPAYFEEFYQ